MVLPTRDILRFQFIIGALPEDTKPGKNIQGSMTVTYHVPHTPDSVTLARLRSHVEHEHDENMRRATRTTNTNKRQERSGIARMSIESVRDWFKKADAVAFDDAVKIAVITNTTACIDTVRDCRLAITPQHAEAALL